MKGRNPISDEAHRRLLLGMDERDRAERARKQREADENPPETEPGTVSHLPTAPCFYCGARGWCDHREEGSQ